MDEAGVVAHSEVDENLVAAACDTCGVDEATAAEKSPSEPGEAARALCGIRRPAPPSLYRGIEIRRLTRTDAALDRGPKRAIPLGAIDAVFITVNTSSSRTGFSSELTLESLGFCR